MKFSLFIFFSLISISIISCSKSNTDNGTIISSDSFATISNLKASSTDSITKINLTWNNPNSKELYKVEISYQPINDIGFSMPNPILEDAIAGDSQKLTISLPFSGEYIFTAVAIGKSGQRANPISISFNSSGDSTPLYLKRADTLMSSLVKLYLEGKPRDIWTSTYPQGGGYWDGAAVVWGQGGAFSGYAALKEASENFPDYKSKIASTLDNRLLTSIDKFRTTKGQRESNTVEAYAVYPENGNERFYDDNIWIGIDMADLYGLTKDAKYLDHAKLVWNFVRSGTDTVLGGGVYWKENDSGKMTCSNAPAVVLATKLYQQTGDGSYLQSAKDIYKWVKTKLQDPTDYLYWDNMSYGLDGNGNKVINIGKAKYTYNSGQAIQAAALLYNITGDNTYLKDAQDIASSIFGQWGSYFQSYTLGSGFNTIDPDGHVWFRAILLRGLIELYKIDKNRKYVDAYEKLLNNAWLSNCRNKETNLLNYDFRGGTTQNNWEILHEGACVEMLARLANLRANGL